jgi:uncharacterized protein (DUF302 family)
MAPAPLTAPTVPGMITLPSGLPVTEVADRLAAVAEERGVNVLARIDHTARAGEIGMDLQDCEVLLVGSPTAGTPLMKAAPLVAFDLPLRILVWAGADGRTWVSFHDPDWLGEHYLVPPALIDSIRPLRALVDAVRGV